MNRTFLAAAAITLAALAGPVLAADAAPAGIMEEVIVTAPYPVRPLMAARPAMDDVVAQASYPAQPVMEEVIVKAPYPTRPIMEEVVVTAERPAPDARRLAWLAWLARNDRAEDAAAGSTLR